MSNKLLKPYTEDERISFIVGNNHIKGLRIEEREDGLYAIEKTLDELKSIKLAECLSKAFEYEKNGTVEYKNCVFEMSESNRINLRDTVEALTLQNKTSTYWNDKNDNLVELTIEELQTIRLELILGVIQDLWINKYPTKKSEINNAQTLEELNAININYGE